MTLADLQKELEKRKVQLRLLSLATRPEVHHPSAIWTANLTSVGWPDLDSFGVAESVEEAIVAALKAWDER
jgi:hypothetical protein